MYKVQIYEKVRRSHIIEGKSHRKISKELGINRRSIKKMLAHSAPQGYERIGPPPKPKLGKYLSWIDAILEADKKVHVKQRHTGGLWKTMAFG